MTSLSVSLSEILFHVRSTTPDLPTCFGGVSSSPRADDVLLVLCVRSGERPYLGVEWGRRKVERTRQQRGLLGGNGAFLRA